MIRKDCNFYGGYMSRELVDIGAKKLEVSITGEGTPVIVIETGMGCSFDDWYEIIQEISKEATVLCYHRQGYGASTISEEEGTTLQIAEDLHKLLAIKEIKGPIILVGHSFGGLCVQQYAALYPEEVGGIMLVDSVSINEYEMDQLREKLPSFKKQFSKENIIENWLQLSDKNKEELEKHIKPKLFEEQLKFPQEIQKELLAFSVNPNLYGAMASELKNMCQSGLQIKIKDKLHIPLKSLARDVDLAIKWNVDSGIPEEEARVFEEKWQVLVKEQAGLSTKGECRVIENSKHSIYRTNPQIVINMLKDLIIKVREGQIK